MKQLSIETIGKMLKDSDWRVRQAAMAACQGKDVPPEIIERGLKDSDCDVRQAAMTACQKNGIKMPASRTIEPPETVYKKCIGGVIVCATIPKDAHIRGTIGGKCRASKAIITGIIGEIGGEKAGISRYDMRTVYFEDDFVEIEDFDYSDEECSRGYHFFCTQREAEDY